MKTPTRFRINFLFLMFISSWCIAQHPCGTDLLKEKYIISHPQLALKDYTESYETASNGTIYIIPVIFHILHMNGVANISDAQICNAIDLLNEDFRKKNADAINTIPAFQSIAADAEIEFRLATLDPQGNSTNGIDRILTPLTYNANDSSKINQWPPNKYLNIWTVDSLAPINGISGVKGYAYGPGFASVYPQYDGILIRHDCVGRFGSGDSYQPIWARIMTHEVGHYLNLLHVWGNSFGVGITCTGDDFVSDTPVTRGSLWCNDLYLSTCGYLDNVQNYMNYSYCYTMFTHGQVNRMRTALVSATANRNNLWNEINLLTTGTNISQSCFANGINELKLEDIRVYPNPGNGIFRIINTKNTEIRVYSALGNLIRIESGNTIDLSSFSKGIYFLNIFDEKNRISKKIIIE